VVSFFVVFYTTTQVFILLHVVTSLITNFVISYMLQLYL